MPRPTGALCVTFHRPRYKPQKWQLVALCSEEGVEVQKVQSCGWGHTAAKCTRLEFRPRHVAVLPCSSSPSADGCRVPICHLLIPGKADGSHMPLSFVLQPFYRERSGSPHTHAISQSCVRTALSRRLPVHRVDFIKIQFKECCPYFLPPPSCQLRGINHFLRLYSIFSHHSFVIHSCNGPLDWLGMPCREGARAQRMTTTKAALSDQLPRK